MIQQNCTSAEWIQKVATSKKADKVLVQKLIRALLLLEGLKESELSFIFKGGTALMLLLNSTRRLSIDIDIIIPQKVDDLSKILSNMARSKGFSRVEEKKRTVLSDIQKAHFKFFFPCSLKSNNEEFILLDFLFEENHYLNLVSTPIASSFIQA